MKQEHELVCLQGFSYHSEDGTRGLLNLGKKHLDHQNWEKLILHFSIETVKTQMNCRIMQHFIRFDI